jgi:3-hydroxyacyl-[acyl-carrier-protein] dehydratase
VAGKKLIVDLAQIDMNNVTADLETIRRFNPQRYEMEQLTAIVYEDVERKICVGYKDVTHEEFWNRGHMPGMPLMPGVIMLEAMAQMCSYFVQKHDLLGSKVVGFGGVEDVHFRGPVIPGDRLMLLCELTKLRRGRMVVCRFEGVVRDTLVVDGVLKGIPLPVDALSAQQATT